MTIKPSIIFRPATAEDFDYCFRIYIEEARKTTPAGVDMEAVANSIRERWDKNEVRLILRDGVAVGWAQVVLKDDSLFLRQFMIDAPFQRQELGTAVLNMLIDEATAAGLPMTLGVVKTNPARRLYERHGFRLTHEDDRKFYMCRDRKVKT